MDDGGGGNVLHVKGGGDVRGKMSAGICLEEMFEVAHTNLPQVHAATYSLQRLFDHVWMKTCLNNLSF